MNTPIYLFVGSDKVTLGLQTPFGVETQDYSHSEMRELLSGIIKDIDRQGSKSLDVFERAFDKQGMEMGFLIESWDDLSYEKYLGGG